MHDLAPHPERLPRRILGVAAWTCLALIVVGIFLSIPSIEEHVVGPGAAAFWGPIGQLLAIITGATLLSLWAAALWHAVVDPRDHLVPKPMLIAVLVVGNAFSSFFYYFLFVMWQPTFRVKPEL